MYLFTWSSLNSRNLESLPLIYFKTSTTCLSKCAKVLWTRSSSVSPQWSQMSWTSSSTCFRTREKRRESSSSPSLTLNKIICSPMTPTTSPHALTLSLKSNSSLRTKTMGSQVNKWMLKAKFSLKTEMFPTIRALTCLSRKLEQGSTLTTRLLWEMSETPSLRQSVSSLSSNLRRGFSLSSMLRWTRMIHSLSL